MSDDLFFQEKKGRKLYFIPVLKKGKRSYYVGLRGRPVVEAMVRGLPIWAQIFLMPDRCKQQPKT